MWFFSFTHFWEKMLARILQLYQNWTLSWGLYKLFIKSAKHQFLKNSSPWGAKTQRGLNFYGWLGGGGGGDGWQLLIVQKIQLLKFIWVLCSIGIFLIWLCVLWQYAKYDINRIKETIFFFFFFQFLTMNCPYKIKWTWLP